MIASSVGVGRSRRRRGGSSIAALAVLLGCGGSSDDGAGVEAHDAGNPFFNAGPPAGPVGPGSTDAGAANPGPTAQAPEIPDEPYVADSCGGYEVRCRGVCFTKVGQGQDGCELLFLRDRSAHRIRYAYLGDGVAFLFLDTDDSGLFRVLHVDLASGQVSVVSESFAGVDAGRLHRGELYFAATYMPWGEAHSRYPIMKLSADGTYEPASGMLAQQLWRGWNVIGDHVYVTTLADDGTSSIYRIGLGEALDAPFRPETEAGGELVAAGVPAETVASDGSYVYYAPGYVGPLGRVRIGDPTSTQVLNEDWAYNAASGFFFPEGDSDYVYCSIVGLQRVPKAGGPSELVLDFAGTDRWNDDEQLMAYGDFGGLRHVRFVPPLETVVDEDGDPPIATFADAAAYYAASEDGIVRIDR